MRIVLADREAELTEALWDHGFSTVAEVREKLKVRLAYNTVLSFLRTLEQVLRRTPGGGPGAPLPCARRTRSRLTRRP
jgi:hypothetical protein